MLKWLSNSRSRKREQIFIRCWSPNNWWTRPTSLVG